MANTTEIAATIKGALAYVLATGNSATKLYLRVRPNGTVDVAEETSHSVSEDEYNKRVPHTLSLEILKSARDYSGLDAEEIEAFADNADATAEEIVRGWEPKIREWVEAGNLQNAAAGE